MIESTKLYSHRLLKNSEQITPGQVKGDAESSKSNSNEHVMFQNETRVLIFTQKRG